MDINVEYQADNLASKIKHYLITTMGRISDEANDEEFYRAFSYALREEIMINWLATAQTIEKNDSRMLYYLSMEYLPGRVLSNNITNIRAGDLVRSVMQKMNRGYTEIITHESDPGLGNGGLGRLASCFLDSLATHHYPAQAYGLRYQYGIFEQQIWSGEQIEAPDTWLLSENPWEFRRDLRKVSVKFGGRATPTTNIHGDEIYYLHDFEEVYALPYDIPIIGFSKLPDFSVVPLRLWTTKESPRNFQLQQYNAGRLDQAAENTLLTDVLYPADYHDTGKRTRLKQEFLLVSASLQDIIRHYLSHHDNFRFFSEKVRFQINDTHPSLLIPELIHILTKRYDLPWKMAVDITRTCTGYTNHTIMGEALERWDQGIMQYLLPRQYKVIERLNLEFCNDVRVAFPGDEDRVRRMSIIEGGQVRMANLAIVGSHKVNGVAELHTEIIKSKVFKDFYEMFPDRFVNITNGVTQRRWLLHSNPELASFISKRIGDEWITDFSKIKKLEEFAKDLESQTEFLSIKRRNKESLIEFLEQESRKATHDTGLPFPIIDSSSLFDVQIKRFHEYKRQLMNALHVIMLYNEIRENPQHGRVKRTVIFSGKSAAGYVMAKNIIRLIICIARKINRDPLTSNFLKVVFIENYNVSKAEMIIPAADLSEQISTAGMEASGTGNMKLAINGALTIGTSDGANIEMEEEITEEWWPFTFGCTAKQIEEMQHNQSYNAWEFCAQNPSIMKAVDMLRDRSFAQTESEHEAFSDIYRRLLEGTNGNPADHYFVLKDLVPYYETQKKVEALYRKPKVWAEYALHNIAGMGKFSTDRSIHEYSNKIWGITPIPLDEDILEKIRHEYSEHDKCRIY